MTISHASTGIITHIRLTACEMPAAIIGSDNARLVGSEFVWKGIVILVRGEY